MREFGVDFPSSAVVLLEWCLARGKQNSWMTFCVPELPPTVNNLYANVGKKRVLSKDGRDFKKVVAVEIGAKKATWKPKGMVMALIFYQSPHWVTKRDTIRDMDGDNRVKALFDAIQDCTGIPDFTNWEFHCYKVASAHTRTTVYLFDLGDVVQWYP